MLDKKERKRWAAGRHQVAAPANYSRPKISKLKTFRKLGACEHGHWIAYNACRFLAVLGVAVVQALACEHQLAAAGTGGVQSLLDRNSTATLVIGAVRGC